MGKSASQLKLFLWCLANLQVNPIWVGSNPNDGKNHVKKINRKYSKKICIWYDLNFTPSELQVTLFLHLGHLLHGLSSGRCSLGSFLRQRRATGASGGKANVEALRVFRLLWFDDTLNLFSFYHQRWGFDAISPSNIWYSVDCFEGTSAGNPCQSYTPIL